MMSRDRICVQSVEYNLMVAVSAKTAIVFRYGIPKLTARHWLNRTANGNNDV